MSNCPGTILEVIENPLFNVPDLREKEDFIKMSGHIRSIGKKGWKI
jgi:NitT/TauT family transport system ATP-binding protein